MEKIHLTDNAKHILLSLNKGEVYSPKDSDKNDIILLIYEGLLTAKETLRGFANLQLTDKAIAYLHMNPKLKNPSICDDKKYLITTFIAIGALMVSIISLFKEQILQILQIWNK